MNSILSGASSAAWPKASDYARDAAAETEIKWLTQLVLGVRQIRGEMDISPARKLPVLLLNASANDIQLAASNAALLRRLAGLESDAPRRKVISGIFRVHPQRLLVITQRFVVLLTSFGLSPQLEELVTLAVAGFQAPGREQQQHHEQRGHGT